MTESASPLPEPTPALAPARADAILVVVDGGPDDPVAAVAETVERRLARDFGGQGRVLLADRSGREVKLSTRADYAPRQAGLTAFGSISTGGIPGAESALPALFREADRLGATAIALVAGQAHDPAIDWVSLLLQPITSGELDYVCPAYRRNKLEGALVTGIAYPLTRALYGRRLRQPLGGEVALSLKLARRLLTDEDWDVDPTSAGSDIWLTAKVLSSDARVGQAWLGTLAPPGGDREEPSHILVRVLGPLFVEMERHAPHWQRIAGSKPVLETGAPGLAPDSPAAVDVEPLVASFKLGLMDLQDLWALALSPATLLELRRVGLRPSGAFRLEDALWVRIVYDFAVAHFARLMDRTQLLRSLMPIYLAWVASFYNEAQPLSSVEVEARVEQLCQVFERNKPYLIGRWRWPDRFNP